LAEETDNLDFAPNNPTDGRGDYEWWTKYPTTPRMWMLAEAIYLLVLLAVCPLLLFLVWKARVAGSILGVDDRASDLVLWRYSTAWLAGTLGGALFSTKWLYHSAAKGRWHQDRRYWRVLTPHLSGGLAFGFYAVANSSLLLILDHAELQEGPTIVALCFLVGYFSDNATAALTRLADRVFGRQDQKPRSRNRSSRDSHQTAAETGGGSDGAHSA
jgi:hypothetical protein